MRRLLSVLMAIALAMLPVGGMAPVAHASTSGHATPCHHDGEPAPAARGGHEDHEHYAQAAGTSMQVLTDDHGSGAMHSGHAAPAIRHGGDPGNSAPFHCPHCGPGCHCVGICAGPAGKLVSAADGSLALRELVAEILVPAKAATPRSWTEKPWPPPPRA